MNSSSAASAEHGRLSARVAIVSGAGAPIGSGIAQRLAMAGASVVLVDADATAARKTRDLIEQAGGSARLGPAAPADRDEANRVVRDTLSRYERLDILVAGADYRTRFEPLADKSLASFDTAMRAFNEALGLIQAVFPAMCASGGGSIIALGSTCGHHTHRFIADYKAAKEALKALVFSAAHEWAPFNIRANMLEAAADTDAFRHLEAIQGEAIAAQLAMLPMRRMGDVVHDIGGAALFLASDDARYLTGEVIHADGGEHLSSPVVDPDPALKEFQ